MAKILHIFFTALSLLFLVFLTYIFLFRNQFLSRLLISKDSTDDGNVKETASTVGRLSFWIRLMGLYYFVSSCSDVLTRLPYSSSAKDIFVSFWWERTGPDLITLVISILFVLKSEKIEELINRFNKKDAGPSFPPEGSQDRSS